MGKRLKNVSKKKDTLSMSKRKTRSASIANKNLESIPVELIIEILSKLSVKSIGRSRCVSKEWTSILHSSDFTNRFLTVSSSRPRLIFLVKTKDKILFLSAPQPLNLDKNSSLLLVDYYMSFPMIKSYTQVHALVNGLLWTEFRSIQIKRGHNDSKVMIHNPSTGQSVPPLPIMRGRRVDFKTYLGYDPINKQYKVLCLSMHRNHHVFEYHVLTLGIEKPAWKMIQCSIQLKHPHSPICINGVLYYFGYDGTEETIVCFDVRSEKLKSIKADYKIWASFLINYHGKLGVLPRHYFNAHTTRVELLVLDDFDKKEWSQHIYLLPPSWKNLVANLKVHIVGMTRNGELVFSTQVVSDPFYVFFYNVEKNTVTRFRIQGIDFSMIKCIHTFIDHLEDVKLL